jgi:hypothetical protein
MNFMKTILLIIFIVGSGIAGFGQTGNSERIFAGIDEQERQGVESLLHTLLESYRNHDWETLSDIFPPFAVRPLTKKEFIERSKNFKSDSPAMNVIDFIPVETRRYNSGPSYKSYTIEGCLVWKSGNEQVKENAFVTAYRNKDNKWFLVGYWLDTGPDKGTSRCPIS